MSRNLTLPKWEIKLSWKFRVTRWLPARFSHLSRVRSSLLPDKRQVQGRNASCFPVQRLLIEPRLLTISFRLVSVLPKTKHLVSYRSENFSEFVIASLETKAYFRTLFISKLTNLNDSVFKPFLNAFFQSKRCWGCVPPLPRKELAPRKLLKDSPSVFTIPVHLYLWFLSLLYFDNDSDFLQRRFLS